MAAGAIWALIVKVTDYEVGILAWAIGFVAGSAVALVVRGRKTAATAAIAIAAALVGILFGKYLTFVFIARDQLSELGADVPIVSGDTWSLFTDNLDIVFSLWDVLWVGLAVFAAWRAARPEAPATPARPDAV